MIKKSINALWEFLFAFFKWILLAGVVGVVSGLVGTLFHTAVEEATHLRQTYPMIILLLPLGGLLIVWIYKITSMSDNKGTDDIIDSVRTDKEIMFRTAPLIFIATAITHLLGGSAGREGAALQLGGSIGYKTGKLFKAEPKDSHVLVMCGMSALFSALFGTPLTASIFAIEVVSVGLMYYSALVPCVISAFVAFGITKLFAIEPTYFALANVPDLAVMPVIRTVILAMLCAGVSVIFCLMLHSTADVLKKRFKNPYFRIAVGGIAVVVLTVICQSTDYNGAGTNIIQNAVNGDAKYEAFLLKMIFTAITIGAGFKGGEIVPTFFVGATFGCVAGSLLGLDAGFGAAVGMTAMFCGMLNCPIASIILSIEIFGGEGIALFAIASAVSYMLSGYFGLYHSQKIVYSKLKAEYINKNTK